jgi:hypothetical protein
MKRVLLLTTLLLFIGASQLYAATTLRYSFTDLKGKTYNSDTLKGTTLVVYIGSHW